MYISLKFCDEEIGKCASNPMSRYSLEIHSLEESVVGWCPSSVWIPSRHTSSRVPSEMEDDMYIGLMCCDEETGKCGSNSMCRQGEEVHALEGPVVGWCLSCVWLPNRHTSSRVPSEMEYDMYISLKCCDEETGKCASNPMSRQVEEVHDLEESVVGCGVHRAPGYPADMQVHEYHLKWKMTCT